MPRITDDDLTEFLKWALPRMGYRWAGFKKVRGQVKSRISERLDELGIAQLEDYREYLQNHRAEWERLDECCYITISRFYRDAAVWDGLRSTVLPALADRARADGRQTIRALSLGAASGEEPYTLKLCWELDERRPWEGMTLTTDAIDAAEHMVERADAGVYPPGNLKELPDEWIDIAFEPVDGQFRLRDEFRRHVHFQVADIRDFEPSQTYDLIFCRNLAFIYFDESGREQTLHRLAQWARPGAVLVVGNRDIVPDDNAYVSLHPTVDFAWQFN